MSTFLSIISLLPHQRSSCLKVWWSPPIAPLHTPCLRSSMQAEKNAFARIQSKAVNQHSVLLCQIILNPGAVVTPFCQIDWKLSRIATDFQTELSFHCLLNHATDMKLQQTFTIYKLNMNKHGYFCSILCHNDIFRWLRVRSTSTPLSTYHVIFMPLHWTQGVIHWVFYCSSRKCSLPIYVYI